LQVRLTARAPIAFNRVQSIAAGTGVRQLALVDVNRDDRPDIVIRGGAFLNDGTGRFDDEHRIVLPTQAASALVVADLNGDGAPDVVAVSPEVNPFAMPSTLQVSLGDGAGNFATQPAVPLNQQIYDLAVGDFDADGILDIVALASDRIYLFRGSGDGQLGAPEEPGIDPGGLYGSAITAALVDADQTLDLIVSHGSDSLTVLLGKGGGAFKPARQYHVGKFPGRPVVADLDGDGRLDIAAVDTGEEQGSDISVLLGSADYPLQTEMRLSAGYTSAFTDLAAADFDSDGRLDLVATPEHGQTATVLRNDRTATFAASALAPDATVRGLVPGEGQTAVRVADLDGDGRPDLVIASNASLSVFLNITGQPQPCAGDCNGDGEVTIDELIILVNIALGNIQSSVCDQGAPNGTQVDISVVVTAVNDALNGCGSV